MAHFLENKYTKWYFNIIYSAQKRTEIDGYFEKHHIIPKSLGGSNRKEKIRQSVLNLPLHTCEHCDITTTKGNYRRWHGDNCKLFQGELKFLA
jgi:hypothetical protein